MVLIENMVWNSNIKKKICPHVNEKKDFKQPTEKN